MKRYDDYWDADLKAKSGEVKFVFQQDPNTRVNALMDGEVDGGWFIPSNAYEQLKTSGPGELYYGLNTTVVSQIVSNLKGPLGDADVRKALLMATDREGIIKAGEQESPRSRTPSSPRAPGAVCPRKRSTRSTTDCRTTSTTWTRPRNSLPTRDSTGRRS